MRQSQWLLLMLAAAAAGAGAQTPGDPPPGADTDKAIEQRIETMQDQMKQLRSENDPAERDKLMREHMHNMREGMAMMDRTPEAPKGNITPSRCRADQTQCRVAELEERQQESERRMHAMRGMMTQMLDQLEAQSAGQTGQPAPDAPAPNHQHH